MDDQECADGFEHIAAMPLALHHLVSANPCECVQEEGGWNALRSCMWRAPVTKGPVFSEEECYSSLLPS